MKPRDLDVDGLYQFAENIRKLLAEGALASLPDPVRAELLIRFRDDHASLLERTEDLKFLKVQVKRLTDSCEVDRANVLEASAEMEVWLKVIGADDADYKLFGFDPPSSLFSRQNNTF